jgi:hypothetical protein
VLTDKVRKVGEGEGEGEGGSTGVDDAVGSDADEDRDSSNSEGTCHTNDPHQTNSNTHTHNRNRNRNRNHTNNTASHHRRRHLPDVEAHVAALRAAVLEATGLVASVGVGRNKLIARMATVKVRGSILDKILRGGLLSRFTLLIAQRSAIYRDSLC